MSRREFLGCAAAATLPLPHAVRGGPARRTADTATWLLHADWCVLPESLQGYRSLLSPGAAAGDPGSESRIERTGLLAVFPAIVDVTPAASLIRKHLARGATVVVESGAGFADPADARRHRDSLREVLAITVGEPVNVWPDLGYARTPYVNFSWPTSALVRDCSRVVPVGRNFGEIIAWTDGMPVALKRRTGNGTLVYLGSPVGIPIRFRDGAAATWMSSLLASASQRGS